MRNDLNIIQNWIRRGSNVLDLGCGDGTLLRSLMDNRQVQGYGLEISPNLIEICVSKGVNVIDQDINFGLKNFADNSFDMVVMTQALQAMEEPHRVLEDMLRVGQECIVTFPNFGHWKARWHLAVKGRMPVSDLLPYQWYDTPNIHFCTFKDFEVLCREMSIEVVARQVVAERPISGALKDILPNLCGETALYHLRRK